MDRTRLRHEIAQLAALIGIALSVFFLTRMFATYTRTVRVRDAAEWYNRGQAALTRGDALAATEDFRRATARDRSDRRYSLALARALETSGNLDAAERALLALREFAPEDADINFELAQTAGARGDVPDAVRYYRNALYAPAAAADADLRRHVRLQLVAFLLAHGDRTRAQSELLAAAADAAPDADSAVALGDLFSEAGDFGRAEEQYVRAVRLAPQSEIARLIPVNDPLARRIPNVERERRLGADLQVVQQRLADCATTGRAADAVRSAAEQIARFTSETALRSDPDTLNDGLALIYEGEHTALEACGNGTPIDRALLVIGRLHGAAIP